MRWTAVILTHIHQQLKWKDNLYLALISIFIEAIYPNVLVVLFQVLMVIYGN